jgi:hypothetical protein
MNDPAVAAMNAMPKYVASHTLRDLRWANSTLLGADLAEEVSRIKAASETETVEPPDAYRHVADTVRRLDQHVPPPR